MVKICLFDELIGHLFDSESSFSSRSICSLLLLTLAAAREGFGFYVLLYGVDHRVQCVRLVISHA